MGAREETMGLADGASSANTFWVEAMVSNGKRGRLNRCRPVTSPIGHLAL